MCRLFNNMPEAKADYHTVPTVVFSHPTIATVGYTEQVRQHEDQSTQLPHIIDERIIILSCTAQLR